MKKIANVISDEDGSAQLVEAAIIYPIVFLFIFVLIYIGLFVLQFMTVSAYAQKIAMLASREVAYPGYIDLVSGDVYKTAAVEADLGKDGNFDNKIVINFDPKQAKVAAYRYWGGNALSNGGTFENILKEMTKKNSIIAPKGEVTAKVECKNYFVTQYVIATVSQPLMDFPILDFFGIKTPTVSSSVQASVNDADELVRNVDFAADAVEVLAKKLGIDVAGIKEKMISAKETLGLD